MKTILITGGSGFIGSNITLKLKEKGYDVVILDSMSPQIHGEDYTQSELYQNIKDKVTFIKGTVTSREDLEKALSGVDAVIHLAAETGTGQSMYEISRYVDVNVGGTAIMLDILANQPHQVKKIVVASSRSIYGEGRYKAADGTIVYPTSRDAKDLDARRFEVYDDNGNELELLPTDENSQIHPSSVYGITKQNQEQMIMTVCPTIGIAPVAFRYQNVYGPGQSLKNPYTGILSIFSTLINDDKEINVFEDGKESRDFVFIDDVVDATILGLEKEEANGKVYNVGTGVQTDVLQVCDALYKNYNKTPKFAVSGNYRLGDIRHNFADLTKIKNDLGFEPKHSFESGIESFCNWVSGQNTESSNYEKSLEEMRGKGLLK